MRYFLFLQPHETPEAPGEASIPQQITYSSSNHKIFLFSVTGPPDLIESRLIVDLDPHHCVIRYHRTIQCCGSESF
jgi:hypothetical protein